MVLKMWKAMVPKKIAMAKTENVPLIVSDPHKLQGLSEEGISIAYKYLTYSSIYSRTLV